MKSVIMTREEVEDLIRWFPKWPRLSSYKCSYCHLVDSMRCLGCPWNQVLRWICLKLGYAESCFPTAEDYMVRYGCTPQRLLAKFLIENNLARPSKVPGKWEVMI